MYCVKCGKEIHKDWKACPNCGEKIDYENETTEKPEERQCQNGNSENKQSSTLRIVMRIFAIAALCCFFCPLYMVSCAGQDILSVSGCELAFGFEYMGEKIDGNLGYALLALFPLLSIYGTLANRKKLEEMKEYDRIKSLLYDTAASGGAIILVNFFFTAVLKSVFRGSGLGIETCMALNVMTASGIVLLLAAGYQVCKMEIDLQQGETKNKLLLKTVGKILMGSIMGLILSIIILYAAGGMSQEQISEEYLSKDSNDVVSSEEITLSNFDMEDYIGQAEEKFSELGFADGKKDGISVEFDSDGLADMILIQGASEDAPCFHGIELGMDLQTAETLLEDAYLPSGQLEENLTYLNSDSGISVGLQNSNGIISQIVVKKLSKEEIQTYLNESYVFPESNKKYLSEEEVRSVEADQLPIARNEIYARHGYIFGDETYKQYFESMPWYKGTVPSDQFNADQVFNDYEKKNVELIKKVEDELNGNAEQQAAIDGAYSAVAGKTFAMQDSQTAIEFTEAGELIAIGYYSTWPELENKYTTYSISARYEVYKDNQKAWLTFITIEGVEYYFRYFTDGSINLAGSGEFDGWYNQI